MYSKAKLHSLRKRFCVLLGSWLFFVPLPATDGPPSVFPSSPPGAPEQRLTWVLHEPL